MSTIDEIIKEIEEMDTQPKKLLIRVDDLRKIAVEEAALRKVAEERDVLRADQAQETDEFNAGYSAFESGLNVDNAEIEYYAALPPDVKRFDSFRIGYAWAKYKAGDE